MILKPRTTPAVSVRTPEPVRATVVMFVTCPVCAEVRTTRVACPPGVRGRSLSGTRICPACLAQ